MGCCGSRQTTESERLLTISSERSFIATPSPSPSASPSLHARDDSSSISPIKLETGTSVDSIRPRNPTDNRPISRRSLSSSNHETPSTLDNKSDPAHPSRAQSKDFTGDTNTGASSSFRDANDANSSPIKSRRTNSTLKLDLNNLATPKDETTMADSGKGSAISVTYPPSIALDLDDVKVSTSPRSPISPRRLVKKLTGKMKSKSRTKTESNGDDFEIPPPDANSDVQFAEYPEIIPTEDQKTLIQKKTILDLRTEEFAPEFFEEIVQANALQENTVKSEPSEVNKKKSARGFIKDTFKSITPKKDKERKDKQDSKDNNDLGTSQSALGLGAKGFDEGTRLGNISHPSDDDKAGIVSPRRRTSEAKSRSDFIDKDVPLHSRDNSSNSVNDGLSSTRKDLRDILSQNNVRLAVRKDDLERLGETVDKMENQSSMLRSLAGQLLSEAKK